MPKNYNGNQGQLLVDLQSFKNILHEWETPQNISLFFFKVDIIECTTSLSRCEM